MVEPTLLSPMASPLASVGLASHLAALLRLAPTVVKTHRVVQAYRHCNALEAEYLEA